MEAVPGVSREKMRWHLQILNHGDGHTAENRHR
jgi:hypothetical protein